MAPYRYTSKRIAKLWRFKNVITSNGFESTGVLFRHTCLSLVMTIISVTHFFLNISYSLKKGEGVPLLNFERGPGVPLLNFEEGPGFPLLNFEGGAGSQVPGSWSQFYTMPF